MADAAVAADTSTAPAPLLQGSFTVVLGDVRYSNQQPNDSAAPAVWASVDVVTGTERSTSLWWATTPDTAHRASTSVLSVSTIDDETDHLPSFKYSQASKPFVLTESSLIPTLVATIVRVSLYEGALRDKDADKLVHTVDVSLRPLVLGQQLDATISFTDVASVHVAVAFDVGFVEYFKGCKALAVVSGAITRLPQDWKLVPKEGEDATALIASPEANGAKYHATITLPALDASQASLTIALEGKLALVGDGQDPTAAWVVPLVPVDPTQFWFLPKVRAHVDAFMEWLQGKSRVAVSLQRVQPGADTWTASSTLLLASILVPGTDNVTSVASLGQGFAPTRESLEEVLAKATTNDDKKKAQAALNDYENVLAKVAGTVIKDAHGFIVPWTNRPFLVGNKRLTQLVAAWLGQAATYVSAGTELELRCQLLPGPWVPLPPVPTPPSMTLAELIPPRAPLPPYPQRDALVSMHKELRRIISMLMVEYDKLFSTREDDDDNDERDDDDDDANDEYTLSKEDRRQKLIFHLNTEGIYFDFKEKLKKALVALIREKFPSVVTSPSFPLGAVTDPTTTDKTAFYAQLYTYLMEEVHVVLNGVFHGTEVHAADDVSPDVVRAKLVRMRQQAWESEVNGQLKKATTLHMDRLHLAESHALALADVQAQVWYEFALFYFRTHELAKGKYLDVVSHRLVSLAGECLRQCIAFDATHVAAIHAYGALLCQNHEFDVADIVLKNSLAVVALSSSSTDQARSHGLLALYYTISQADVTGNLCLHELVQAAALTGTSPGGAASSSFPSPTSVCIALGAYCKELGLFSLAYQALTLGDVVLKPKTVLSTHDFATQKLVRAAIDLHFGNLSQASQWCQDALDQDPTFANGWYLHGVIATRQNALLVALESYGRALASVDTLAETYHLPLYLQLGALYMHHQQWGPAKSIFLRACHETSVASSWLGVGVVCVRQDDWDGAEMALAEANILDHTNPDVWGYLSLVCLSATPARQKEAEQALEQALRYDLSNATLLRELSNGFVALDRLEVAESLLRRSLLTGDSSLTRKTLADVLAAQNCASTALDQYKKALDGCTSMDDRTTLLGQCADLLSTLGRLDEAKEYREMAAHQQEGAENEAFMDRQFLQRLSVNNAP
ncbi:Aste57867_20828 [Aphanomyces stellatus]|uniref:Aste57867_20828 protein n=1 Tax=Aphanomyces stellatus TaxID=120398 RepID=A0A485LH67_9STRA|nr:hypothetical protein As57867_020760 [Aphanomyces stellatus]VFT97507.1 Aste57867_20828 [Aphanomyces stellatus]